MRHATMPALVLFLFLTGCTISEEQEIAIGRDAAPQFEQEFGGIYPDPAVQNYVQDIGMELVRHTDRPNLPWRFRVLNSDQVNAFALPGGFIYITQGLLGSLENEAQLASVIGHEIAHVDHRHSVQQLQRSQLIGGGAALAGLISGSGAGADASSLVAGLALMSYSRGQEKEADLSGLNYIARQGYQPRAIVETMRILKEAGGGGGPPEFFSSHPDPKNRGEYLTERIEDRYANVISVGRTNEDRFDQIVGRLRNAVGQR